MLGKATAIIARAIYVQGLVGGVVGTACGAIILARGGADREGGEGGGLHCIPRVGGKARLEFEWDSLGKTWNMFTTRRSSSTSTT